MHELFNFVSGLEQEVTVKLSSASDHEFAQGSSFIYNMYKVVFEPYNVNIKYVSEGIQEFGKSIWLKFRNLIYFLMGIWFIFEIILIVLRHKHKGSFESERCK